MVEISQRMKLELYDLKKQSVTYIFYGILCLLGFLFFSWLWVACDFDSGYYFIVPFLDMFLLLLLMCLGFGIWFLYSGINGYKEYKKIIEEKNK